MNKNNSLNDYIHRYIEARLKKAINVHPAVIITGPRQVGKSTLLKKAPELAGYRYYNFDSLDTLSAVKQNPEEMLKMHTVIIDEVQKFPEILTVVKKIIDDTNRKVKFILSGSANLLLMRKVSESLAGRAIFMNLFPFSIGELMGSGKDNILDLLLAGKKVPKEGKQKGFNLNIKDFLWKGFMPVPQLQLKNESEITEWFDGYVTTYLERDLRDVRGISDLSDYKRFLKIMALYNGTILDETAISRELQISQPTIHRYVGMLETTYIISKIPCFEKNKKKRVVKRPKIYWFDTGLVNFLAGNFTSKGLSEKKEYGLLFETAVLHNLKVWASLKVPKPVIYYWRLCTGEEVDFIVEVGDEVIPIEIKAKKEIGHGDIKSLLTFFSAYPKTRFGLLVYAGDKIIKMTQRIIAVPYETLCVNNIKGGAI